MQASLDLPHARALNRRPALIPKCFGVFTLFLLTGYAFFGKGFAYLGIPPYGYLGEIGVLLGIATLCTVVHVGLWRSGVTWLLLAFMAWGCLRTIPYLETYGMFALRDSVIWAYAIFALAGATALLRLSAIDKVISLYSRAVPVFLIVAPILLAIGLFAGDHIPRWPWGPGGDVPILDVKSGDLAVTYAGIFSFVVLGLSPVPIAFWWPIPWILGVGPLVAISRGAMVTVATVVGGAMLLRPTVKHYYAMGLAFACAAFFFLSVAALSPNGLDLGLSDRRIISFSQLGSNVESIFDTVYQPDLDLEGTKRWRQLWWDRIIDYTFHGEFFWTGKGFGINLADDDGFATSADHSLRSPHSAHMTVLARAGVPGLLLWIAVQLTFAMKLLMNFLRDTAARRSQLASLELWVLLYWCAYMINGSFDVFLEGPQGGIWFWSIFGFGLALITAHDRLVAASVRHNTSAYAQ